MNRIFRSRSLPVLVKLCVAWAVVSVLARVLAGGEFAPVAWSSAAGICLILAVFVAMTRGHREAGRRLDAGELTNAQYVRACCLSDLRWSLAAIAIAAALGALDSPVWWLSLFAAVSLFVSMEQQASARRT